MSERQTFQPLWTPLGLVSPLKARVSGHVPKMAAGGISIDTRSLRENDLFFAIKGENSDGHAYVEDAFAKGAMAAVVDEAHSAELKHLGPLYVVRDVLQSLEGLGGASRARTLARIVAVTGSVGKTSTKEALRIVLTQAGRVHASIASYNNHWGVPLSLARMPKETGFGIFEIGMNHAREIIPLTGMVRPHIAIITTIASVHLENFASLEDIAEAKAEIFSGLVPGGVAILHRDIDQYERLASLAKASPAGLIATFGDHEDADARLISVTLAPDHCLVEANICGDALTYRLGAPGRHLAINSLAVLLAAKALGVDLVAAAASLAFFTAGAGRGERLKLRAQDGPFTLIDESYNANPASMRAAFILLGSLPISGKGRRIAVLGDMLELGPLAPKMHYGLVQDMIVNRIDLVFATGPLMHELYRALPEEMRGAFAPTAEELATTLGDRIAADDMIVVKGSNGSRMGKIVSAFKERFPLHDIS
jgi:UDP-N-acetylmuramoyl-tripeptide--D-alanyl-D-alanine ligase